MSDAPAAKGIGAVFVDLDTPGLTFGNSERLMGWRGIPSADIYFDNVGADHLQAAIMHMRQFGRIPLCGAIAQYNDTEPRPGPNNLAVAIGLGLTLRGFIVSHFDHLKSQFRNDMESWVNEGSINSKETVYEGIDNAGEAFIGLFTGANTGKMIVNLEN